MADGAEVHADLMGPAGVDRHLAQRHARQMMRAGDARHRAARAACARRHLLPVHRIAADSRIDAAAGLDDAPHERDVFLLDLAIVKLPRQLLVRRVVLGDHHHARRAAVEAMDDAGPRFAADAAQIRDVVEQRVDERAGRVAGARMHDHPAGLLSTARSASW